MRNRLKFREDGTFVIVQFSDTEFTDRGAGCNDGTLATMERIVQAEQPDLIVYAGDVTASEGCANPAVAMREAASVAERRNIPWAAVFGNHDSEAHITREQLHVAQLAMPNNVALPDPPGVSGVGNYTLDVCGRDGKPAAGLYFLDTGSYSPLSEVSLRGYDWIRRSQIDWYVAESRERTKRGGGNPLPSLAFFHIPLPEYKELWDFHIAYGRKFENISSPQINSGFFAAMVEMGDVMGTFVGHDHDNDFRGSLHGIQLCYGRSTQYTLTEGFQTGARVIRLHEGEREFDTWIRTSDGEVAEEPVHEPEGRKA